jgi:hypothetical protein
MCTCWFYYHINKVFNKQNGGVDWITLAHCSNMWLALVNTVIKLWVTYMKGNSRLSEELKATQDRLC